MRSLKRPLVWLVALFSVFALVGAACSSDKSNDTATTDSTAGEAPSGANIDYASLSGTLNGSGSTFQKAFDEECIAAFGEVAPDVTVNYGGGGSGKGKQDLADQVVQWAGTDSLVKDADAPGFKGGAFLYFPTVAAPVTVSYNLSSVDKLQLSPDTLAKIFQADITTWDDPAIAADNPGVTLPSEPIVVAHRAEGSGTTSVFTKYLSTASTSWTLDSGDTVNWPANAQAGQGNSGVAQIVKDTAGAIGYVDYSDAVATGLTFAAIKNADGNYVQASLEGASDALAGATINDNLTYNALNTPGANSYPITAGTYVLVYAHQPDQGTADALKGWLNFLLTEGQTIAPTVDFAPLPPSLQQKAVAQLDMITVG